MRNDNGALLIAAAVALLAVIGLVMVLPGSNNQGSAVVIGVQTAAPEGVLPQYGTGADLGRTIAADWDGQTEAKQYCSRQCGDACADAYLSAGLDQKNCYRGCQTWCGQEVQRLFFGRTRKGTSPSYRVG